MSQSYKTVVDNHIASSFKAHIADQQRNIDKIKCAQATNALEYKRMISEDPTVVTKTSSESFAEQCISYVTRLRELYDNWKTISNYAD